jgi:uncharacterized membrane protein
MIEFTNQVFIEQPLDKVFGFVSDFENIPKWNYYVLSVNKTTAGPVSEGTTYHQVRKTDEQDFQITTHRPGRHVTIQTLPSSKPAFEMRFTFEPEEGGTRITDEWKLDTGRPTLLERLAAGKIKSAVRENLGKLKALMETGEVRLQDGRRMSL